MAKIVPEESCDLLEIFHGLDKAKRWSIYSTLSEFEKIVFNQIINPNFEAWIYLIADQCWDEDANEAKFGPVKLKFEYKHLALGLQLKLVHFMPIVESIRNIILAYLEGRKTRAQMHQPLLSQLEKVFDLRPFPPSLDLTIVRRLLTVEAHNKIEKVDKDATRMFEEIGVKPSQYTRAFEAQAMQSKTTNLKGRIQAAGGSPRT